MSIKDPELLKKEWETRLQMGLELRRRHVQQKQVMEMTHQDQLQAQTQELDELTDKFADQRRQLDRAQSQIRKLKAVTKACKPRAPSADRENRENVAPPNINVIASDSNTGGNSNKFNATFPGRASVGSQSFVDSRLSFGDKNRASIGRGEKDKEGNVGVGTMWAKEHSVGGKALGDITNEAKKVGALKAQFESRSSMFLSPSSKTNRGRGYDERKKAQETLEQKDKEIARLQKESELSRKELVETQEMLSTTQDMLSKQQHAVTEQQNAVSVLENELASAEEESIRGGKEMEALRAENKSLRADLEKEKRDKMKYWEAYKKLKNGGPSQRPSTAQPKDSLKERAQRETSGGRSQKPERNVVKELGASNNSHSSNSNTSNNTSSSSSSSNALPSSYSGGLTHNHGTLRAQSPLFPRGAFSPVRGGGFERNERNQHGQIGAGERRSDRQRKNSGGTSSSSNNTNNMQRKSNPRDDGNDRKSQGMRNNEEPKQRKQQSRDQTRVTDPNEQYIVAVDENANSYGSNIANSNQRSYPRDTSSSRRPSSSRDHSSQRHGGNNGSGSNNGGNNSGPLTRGSSGSSQSRVQNNNNPGSQQHSTKDVKAKIRMHPMRSASPHRGQSPGYTNPEQTQRRKSSKHSTGGADRTLTRAANGEGSRGNRDANALANSGQGRENRENRENRDQKESSKENSKETSKENREGRETRETRDKRESNKPRRLGNDHDGVREHHRILNERDRLRMDDGRSESFKNNERAPSSRKGESGDGNKEARSHRSDGGSNWSDGRGNQGNRGNHTAGSHSAESSHGGNNYANLGKGGHNSGEDDEFFDACEEDDRNNSFGSFGNPRNSGDSNLLPMSRHPKDESSQRFTSNQKLNNVISANNSKSGTHRSTSEGRGSNVMAEPSVEDPNGILGYQNRKPQPVRNYHFDPPGTSMSGGYASTYDRPASVQPARFTSSNVNNNSGSSSSNGNSHSGYGRVHRSVTTGGMNQGSGNGNSGYSNVITANSTGNTSGNANSINANGGKSTSSVYASLSRGN